MNLVTQRPTSHQRYHLPKIGRRKKIGYHVVVVGRLILLVVLLWVCVSFRFLRNLPTASHGDGVPPILQPKLQLGNGKSPYRIVHSLTTRFMLGQKGQPTLARARYLLFETFCHPTVRYQTEGYDFSWFVLVDPGIDKTVIEDMRVLLASNETNFPKGNAYLILTDNPAWAADGVGVPGVTSYGAGFQEIARAVRDSSVKLLTGNATRLMETLEEDIEGKSMGGQIDANQPLMLIETLLDADDGLNIRAVGLIQELAVSHTEKQQHQILTKPASDADGEGKSPSLDSTWWLLCGTDHVEWHNRDIFRLTDKQYEKDGLTSGIIGLRHAPQYCASAGFTRVGLTTLSSTSESLQFPQVAYSNHALATEQFDLCNDGSGGDPNITLSHCFRRDFPDVPFILKSRSITSDSMDHMDPKRKDYRDLPWETPKEHPLLGLDDTERMWGIVKNGFSINPNKAWETSIYMRENLEAILKENKKSRCAPGFPCRKVADVAFKKMTMHINKLNKPNPISIKKNGARTGKGK